MLNFHENRLVFKRPKNHDSEPLYVLRCVLIATSLLLTCLVLFLACSGCACAAENEHYVESEWFNGQIQVIYRELKKPVPCKAISGTLMEPCLSQDLNGIKEALLEKHEWTDEEIVNAIYKAEGGSHAQYPYGIRSIKCTGEKECRKICVNTVKANKKRYQSYVKNRYSTYLDFLASRFCPTTGKNLSKAEKQCNRFWLSNVRWFLEHPEKG